MLSNYLKKQQKQKMDENKKDKSKEENNIQKSTHKNWS